MEARQGMGGGEAHLPRIAPSLPAHIQGLSKYVFFPNIFKILKFLPAIANFLGIQPVRSGYPTDIRFNGEENG